jgi:hypothetical protein
MGNQMFHRAYADTADKKLTRITNSMIRAFLERPADVFVRGDIAECILNLGIN